MLIQQNKQSKKHFVNSSLDLRKIKRRFRKLKQRVSKTKRRFGKLKRRFIYYDISMLENIIQKA